MNSLSPHLKTLVDDKKWRVREAAYQTLIDLALQYQVFYRIYLLILELGNIH